jgi:hypothetical protein
VSGTPEAVDFPGRLFWRDQAFQLGRKFEGQGREEKCLLEFQEQSARLGELRVVGAFLHRVVLDEPNGFTVVLDDPPPVRKIPAGHYQASEIWLRQGSAEAVSTTAGKLTVSETAPATLAAGGPLTNTVTITRRGKYLSFDYRLVGSGSNTFRLGSDDRTNPPEVEVYHGGRKIASGKFAYG